MPAERIVFVVQATTAEAASVHFVRVDFDEDPTTPEIDRALIAARGAVVLALGLGAAAEDTETDVWHLATIRGPATFVVFEQPEPCLGLTVEAHDLADYHSGTDWEAAALAIGIAYEA